LRKHPNEQQAAAMQECSKRQVGPELAMVIEADVPNFHLPANPETPRQFRLQ
jgi:hypothetical protein